MMWLTVINRIRFSQAKPNHPIRTSWRISTENRQIAGFAAMIMAVIRAKPLLSFGWRVSGLIAG